MKLHRSAQLAKSIADVTHRRGRTLFVAAGICLGVFGLTAVNVTQDQLASAFAFSIGSQATRPDVVFDVDRLDAAALLDLQAVANVRTVQAETTLQTQWHVARAPGHVDFTIIAYPDLANVPLTPFELVSGRDPGVGEIVMEFGDSAIQPISVGDLVTVDTSQGPSMLRVVGLSRTPGADPATTGAYTGYMTDAALRALPAFTDPVTAPPLEPLRLSHQAVKVIDISTLDTTTHALGAILAAHGVVVLGVGFPEALTAQLRQVDGLFAVLRLLTLLALAMTGILVLNTVRSSIAEQTAIIGTMKAIGSTPGTILRGYLITVAIYGALATLPGIVLGVLCGAALAGLLAQSIPLALGPLAVDPRLIVASLAAGFGVPLLAAAWPVWDGTRISVRAALSAYGVESVTGRGRLARIGGRLGWISQTTWLGLHSTFRRRGRAILTVLMLGVAGASFFIVQTTSASVKATVGRVWSDIHADVEVYASEPYADARAQLASVPNIARMERFGVAGAQTPWGKVAVWGIEPATRLYAYQLTSGRWLGAEDGNTALISDDVAAQSGLRAGSRLVLTTLGGGAPTTFTVIGTLKEPVDSLGQIGAVVVSVTSLYEFEGTPSDIAPAYVNKILVQAQDRTPGGVGSLATRLDAVATNLVRSGALTRGAGLGPVFLVREDEALRSQRNFVILYVLLYAVALIVGAAGVLGLASTLMASVTERQRELGLLRAMGASSWRIGQVFWVEGLALGGPAWCLGGALGLPLAIAFVATLSRLVFPIDLVLDPWAFVVMLLAVVGMVAVASLAAVIQASRVGVARLLRYE